jgi:DNA polymerase-3 subunit epsilon
VALPVLPPKYYLTHFFEFLEFLGQHYSPVMDPPHRKLISDFQDLGEEARCVFVRMINRKGSIFHRDAFKRNLEILDSSGAIEELLGAGFARPLREADKSELFEYLSKVELRNWLLENDVATPVSVGRARLWELAWENEARLSIESLDVSRDLIIRDRQAEMDYLLFLYFGKLQKSLNLYTLRDLGIRRTNTLKENFRARYSDKGEALTEFTLATILDRVQNAPPVLNWESLLAEVKSIATSKASACLQKDEILWQAAGHLWERSPELGLQSLLESKHAEARPKAIRWLYKLERFDRVRELLQEILDQPRSDVELLFAEDFLARKFNKKKVGYLTEFLRSSKEILLSDVYLKRPERGVRDLYRKLGFSAHFTENHMWLGLFGILFWEELFESEHAAIHNPFERAPTDLVGPEFYRKNQSRIEEKLLLFRDVKALERHILKAVARNYGRLNDVFEWHPNLPKTLIDFLKGCAGCDLALVLRSMAQEFSAYHLGFPDLMLEKDGALKFIEVKAEGDVLRFSQLASIRLLKQAGFDVEVLRVKWQTDPNQIYTVLDVETTGGTSNSHRVIEVGAVKVQNGLIIDEFQTLINPGRIIPAFIVRYTGITNDMVVGAPTFSDIAEKLSEFIEGTIFVAHNVRFDYGFIQREFARVGMEFSAPTLCTCAGMRKAYPGISSYSLKNLTEHFRISLDQHHRALCDARATAELLLLMNEKRCLGSAVESPVSGST